MPVLSATKGSRISSSINSSNYRYRHWEQDCEQHDVVTIRPVKSSDAASCSRLERWQLRRGEITPQVAPRTMLQWSQNLTLVDNFGYLAEYDGQAIGVILATHTEECPRIVDIERILVSPECQRRGIGTLLLNQIAEHVRSTSYGDTIESQPQRLHASIPRHLRQAFMFFVSNGFQIAGFTVETQRLLARFIQPEE